MELNRRETLEGALAAFGVGLASPALSAPLEKHPLRLWYTRPAAAWTEALPVGNGRLGAMVFGGTARERLQLNEDTLWTGGPYSNVNPAAREALPAVRALIFAGKGAEAEALANERVMAVPRRDMSYQSLGDLFIDMVGSADVAAEDYIRELDLDAAISSTRFTASGVRHRREVIASAPEEVIAVRLTAEGGELGCDLSLATGQSASLSTAADTLVLSGVNGPEHDNPGRIRFEARIRVLPEGGSLTAVGDRLCLRGARAATILIAAATNVRGPGDVSGDPAAANAARIAHASRLGYERLRARHVADHQRLFRRVSIDLGHGLGADHPTDERVRNFASDRDPALAALHYQYGRYLLIASSRPGTQPANLQGIWNDSNTPPWGSKFTININTEMNYWPAEGAALPECVEPLIAMIGELAESGAKTARDMYGARGWVTHHNTDLWRASGPVDSAHTGLWPCGGAWLSTHLWTRYDYNRDKAYLERVYPLMRGAALFFLDTLVVDPRTHALVTCPSLSPENEHHKGVTACAGPTADMQILRDLFGQVIASAEILGIDADLREQLATARARLAPNRIGAAGQLQEWQEDWDMTAPDIHHRHVSHLYGLFPSSQINLDETPDLARAARRSLEIRGDDATGWGLGWRFNLWAHLREGDHAHAILERMLSPGRAYPNLFDAHPPFQIDGNFGATSGITEMLVQSRGDLIDLLPALPRYWPRGRLAGVRVRGACTLDLAWEGGRLSEAILTSGIGGTHRVRTAGRVITIALEAGRRRRLTPELFA